jgi:NitT/TauT family transport system substrate-binding protein
MKRFSRRTALGATGTLAAVLGLGLPVVARQTARVRVGYLHTLAVDGQIWLGQDLGFWKDQGLELDLIRFQTGIQLFQALVGGSIDVLSTGAVISNFPARGQGKAFLINDIEWATAQLWVHPGIDSIAQLRGKRIATTNGTTADVFLYEALKRSGLDISKDVEIVNQPMPEAVTSFIAGAVPAVALWVPFNLEVEKQVPGAKMLIDASAFYPSAAIVDGWATRADFLSSQEDVLLRLIKAWIPANDMLVHNPAKALPIIHNHYSDATMSQLQSMYKAQKMFDAKTWVKYYRDGTVTKWLDHVTDVYVKLGAMQNPVSAKEYFDPSLYLQVLSA